MLQKRAVPHIVSIKCGPCVDVYVLPCVYIHVSHIMTVNDGCAYVHAYMILADKVFVLESYYFYEMCVPYHCIHVAMLLPPFFSLIICGTQ